MKPSFVVFLLDDATALQTRKFLPLLRRRLSDSGLHIVDFDNAFNTTPLCCPSRASLLTGNYAHTTGIRFNEAPDGGAVTFTETEKDLDTIATRLTGQGYATALVGKYLNGYEKLAGPYVPPGWDYWRAIHDPGRGGYFDYKLATDAKSLLQYRSSDADYSTDVFRQWAVRFLRKVNGMPFFLYLSPSPPHHPAIPASRHRHVYPDITGAPRTPSHASQLDRTGKPDWVQTVQWTAAQQAEDDAFYVDQVKSLAAADETMAVVVEQIDSMGRLADTVIVLLSDNGFMHGEHFVSGKGAVYQPSVHTAFAIASKSFVPANATRSEIVGNIDVAPTIAELAGLSPPSEPLDGVSLVPLVTGSGPLAREDLLLERWSKNPSGGGTPSNPIPSWDAVVAWRSARLWKYVELATGTVDTELYDLTGDPHELVNLATRPEHASLVAELSGRIGALKGG